MERPQAAADLVVQLKQWSESFTDAQFAAAKETPPDLPLHLTPHEQACAEPLIHVADWFGGAWPEKARAAISAVFKVTDSSESIVLLSDIRTLFLTKEDPEYLSTRDLLAGLIQLDYRPWGAWNSKSGQRLAERLKPFGIFPGELHRGSAPGFRGYRFAHFQDVWERYVPHITVCRATKEPLETPSATNNP